MQNFQGTGSLEIRKQLQSNK